MTTGIYGGRSIQDLSTVKVKLVDNIDDAMEFRRWLGERRDGLAIDTETTGLHVWQGSRVRLVQFGDWDTGWAIPMDGWRQFVIDTFRDYNEPIEFWNAPFDVKQLENEGVKIPPSYDDGLVLSRICNPLDAAHGLKKQGAKRISPIVTVGEMLLQKLMDDNKWTWETVPIQAVPYWSYACLDTVITARLCTDSKIRRDAQGLQQVYDLEMAVMPSIIHMEQVGVRVDRDYCVRRSDELLTHIDQLVEWCKTYYGVSPGSNQDVAQALVDNGVQLNKLTNKGAFSADKEVLESIEHPLAAAVLQHRQAVKKRSSYFEAFLRTADREDAIHCSIQQIEAKTGRMSIKDPGLQTIPRGDDVRNAFVPRHGNKLVSIDFSQVEMRIMASLADETAMIEAIKAGRDLHTETASITYQTPTPTKEQRQVAKNSNFSVLYGAGLEKFAFTAGINTTDARVFLETYREAFPGVYRFQQSRGRVARENTTSTGYMHARTHIGRVVPLRDGDGEHALANYEVQGSAADQLKMAIYSLDSAGLRQYMRLPIHDEVVFEFPESDAVELTAIAKEAMEDWYTYKVPLQCEASEPLDRWGGK